MIPAGATLSIKRIPLDCLFVTETHSCYPAKFQIYLDLLTNHPHDDVDPIVVMPSPEHPGLYAIINGKHRFCASIMAGRIELLAVVVEDDE